MSNHRVSFMTRRRFVRLGAGAGAGLLFGLGSPRRSQAAKTLRLLTPEADPGQIKAWNAVFEDFGAKHKDITAKGEYAKWDDITKKLAADIAAGSPPEIVAGGSNPSFVAAQVKRGLVLDLAPLIDALGRADFQEAALKVWQYGGIQMAIPYGGQWPVLWYRKDLLAEKGLKPPVTWDDYRAVGEKLTDPAKGTYGAVFSAGRTWNTHLMALITIWSAGGLLFDEKLNVVFDSPETRRALTYYGEMATRFSPPDVGQYGFREASAAFTSGKTATTFYWGRVLSHLYAQAPQLLPKSATAHIPRDKQYRTTLHFDEFYVYRNAAGAKEAVELVKFMLQAEQLTRLLSPVAGHVVPTRKSVERLYGQHQWLKENPEIVPSLITPIDFAISPTHESRHHPFNYKYLAVEEKNVLTDCVQKIVIGKEPVGKAVEWAHRQMVEVTRDIRG
ncbi:MAG: sugar ABC transporter substrate-binding protein [Candidatus Rokubacteria bacterium]|nr:sugar ABC transporter substrate-binding protein [Candidatus Rokubacteria bacterium]